MPKKARELSALEVKRLTRPGFHPVGGVEGLYLCVSGSGARSWILRYATKEVRYSKSGRPYYARRDTGLGPFPAVTLAQARDRAREARDLLYQGIDPVEYKNAARDALRAAAARALTFDQCAERYLAGKAEGFKNAKHAKQWATSLETYASPIVGGLSVDRVELAHVLQILEPIWREKTETASRVRGRIEKVLDYAIVSGYRDGPNPAQWRGNLDAILPQPGKLKQVRHHKALPWPDTPAFLADLRQRDGMAARALEFILLTAARSGEVRGATWGEIDTKAKTWTVPPERMKAGKEHVVPLVPDAVTLLEALPRFKGSDYVFTAPRGGQLSDMSISAVMRRMKVDATPHGLRSTFRDWVSERTSYPHEVAEQALAHTIPSAVERAYRRGSLLEKRRRLMADWAQFLNEGTPEGSVVSIRESR